VIAGVAAVAVTGWQRLDPLLALAVAAHIVWIGWQLMQRSFLGLMDRALPAPERERIEGVLARYRADGVEFHALRTRQAAGRSFMSVHVLVPGDWSVQAGHDLAERVEADLRAVLPGLTVFTHLEPAGDPTSYQDITLDRPRE
jgi:divalent metal cation (Fe/Co/Zn/Cd) transporter